MSDIVERLRWAGSRTSWSEADMQCAAAANEIERLRSEVEALKARLEIDPRHPYDGIYTRDETIRLQDQRIDELKAEVEALRVDAKRYRWLRQRMELRPMLTMSGAVRYGMTTRIGCAFPDSPLPHSTNPEYHKEQSKEVDASIDAAMRTKE